MIHSVAPVEDQQGWGNVMYIPAAPMCPRNERYRRPVREAFLTGSSPSDFPEEHYERSWPDRFAVEDLNETGRRVGLGLRLGSIWRRSGGPLSGDRSATWASSHFTTSLRRTMSAAAVRRSRRSGVGIVSASWIASACCWMSNG